MQSVGQFRQDQVGLLIQPALHLLARDCIDQDRTPSAFSVWFKCATAPMKPQQLFGKEQANAKEFCHLGLRCRVARTGLHNFAT